MLTYEFKIVLENSSSLGRFESMNSSLKLKKKKKKKILFQLTMMII